MLRVLNAECDQLMVMARMNVGALRCHVHLRRRRTGFSTMVGEQPWSNHPLVDLLDRTQQFIGPKGANDSSRSFAECLQRFGRVHCISSKCLLQKSFDWKLRAATRVCKNMRLQFCIGSRRSDHWPSQQVPQTHVLARYASLLPFGLKAAPELRHEKVPETLT